MCGETQCRRLLFEAANEADLLLIEGVMGLYDGLPSYLSLIHISEPTRPY